MKVTFEKSRQNKTKRESRFNNFKIFNFQLSIKDEKE
jgi:hypothetical protein